MAKLQNTKEKMNSLKLSSLCIKIFSFSLLNIFIVNLMHKVARVLIKNCHVVAEPLVSSDSVCFLPSLSLFLCIKNYVVMRVKFDSLSLLAAVVLNAFND